MDSVFTVAHALNTLDNPFAFASVAAATALLLSLLRRNYGLSFFFTIALTFGATHIVKSLYQIARPLDALAAAPGYRFPSMHASLAAAVIASLSWHWYQRITSPLWRLVLIVSATSLVLFIGWTRILLRVHETIDVVVGIVLGIGISLLLHVLMHRYKLD